MRRWKPLAVAGVVVASVGVLVTSSVAATSAKHSNKSVTLVWWHNANQGAGLKLWNDVAKEYHAAHPDVTVKPTGFERTCCRTRRSRSRSQSNNPPDVFQEWGGGALVDAGEGQQGREHHQVRRSRGSRPSAASAAGWQVKGKQYAVPYSLGVVGFWYNKALFKQAGIDVAPATWPQFFADITKLKAANITPIAIGSKDRWPDAFYWDYLATSCAARRRCSSRR